MRRSLLLIFSIVFCYFVLPQSAHAAIQLVGTTTANGINAAYDMTLTDLQGGIGSAPAQGDIVIIINALGNTTDGNPGVGTAGYTEIADLFESDTNATNLSVNYKLMSASPDTTISCNPSDNASIGSVCLAVVFRGVDSSTPLDVASTTAQGNGAEDINCPSITPVTTGAITVCVGGASGTNMDIDSSWPTGYNKTASSTRDVGPLIAAYAGYKAWVSGAEDPSTYSMDFGTAAANSWAALIMVLRPAAAGTVTTAAATVIEATAAKLNGEITSVGGANVTVSGFATSTSSGFTSDVATTTGGPTSAVAFSQTVSLLTPDTTYYFRAYATNGGGTSYGTTESFTTRDGSVQRTLRLFEGARIKLVGGRLVVNQKAAPAGPAEEEAQTVIFLVANSDGTCGSGCWTVPLDWNSTNNTIEVIGGGGGGGNGAGGFGSSGRGGGGGGYSKKNDLSLTSGTDVTFNIGAGGAASSTGGATYFCNSTSNCSNILGSAVQAGAYGGTLGGSSTTGQGATSTSGIGDVTASGGNGNTGGSSASGGGGAGGPNGDGAAGGASPAGGGGAGGGGNSGGSVGGDTSNNNGGAGGNSFLGSGGGAGSTSAVDPADNGTAGGGGGGGFRTDLGATSGGSGGAGTDWDSTHGSGGGGGGGGQGVSGAGAGIGGAGGNYGGGGGGGGTTTGTPGAGGAGAGGIIVISYTPLDTTQIFLTSNGDGTCGSGCWTVPADFNITKNTVEVIGGGGGGNGNTGSGGGGGGAGYSKIVNKSLTGNVNFNVGSGGAVHAGADGDNGGDTYLCNSTSNCASISGSAVVVGATGGVGRATGSGGEGGGGGPVFVASTTYSGGRGGVGVGSGGSGGGGAGGPNGAGAVGGAGTVAGAAGGSGGGGSGGGSAGTDAVSGIAGTAGGNNFFGTGSGAGGDPATNGSSGGGGGGGDKKVGGGVIGGAGGAGTEWDSTHGSGGGGGGGGSSQLSGSGGTGGAGGNYGGGGGGVGASLSGTPDAGVGAGGIVAITYVSATLQVDRSYAESNQSSTRNLSASASDNAGQAFISNGGILDHVVFYLKKTGAPTGTTVAKMYGTTGTCGSTGKPSGLLATSDTFDVSTLTTSYALVTLSFSGAQRIGLTAGTCYALDLSFSGGGIGSSLDQGQDNTSPTDAGNEFHENGDVTNPDATSDAIFYVYTYR